MDWSWPGVNKGWYGGGFGRDFFSCFFVRSVGTVSSAGSAPGIGDVTVGVPAGSSYISTAALSSSLSSLPIM